MLRFGAAMVWWRYEHTNVGIYSDILKCIERISGGILLLNSMVVAVQRAIRGLGGRKGTVWRA